ncbi:MAG: pyridoxal phosphate-dependent decarboxylase family protein [Acidobacteriota bacterium]
MTRTAFAAERGLDPDWEEFRALAHRAVDDVVGHLSNVRDRPAWQPVPDSVRAALTQPLPRTPSAVEDVYGLVRSLVYPYTLGNTHPRHWGWVTGTGTAVSTLADVVAAGLNANCAGFSQSPALVEEMAVRWMAEVMGFPAESSGLFVSSGSIANLTALAVARSARAGYDVRTEGVNGRLTMYCSTETHSSVQKGVEVLGLGSRALRRVAVDSDFRVDVTALERAIRDDRAAGLTPVAVIGNAGTVSTGAIDDLEALASVCRRHGVWFHVDGAFGAGAAFSPRLRERVRGMALADSLSFDPHKWMYLNYDVSLVLVRDPAAHRAAFRLIPPYLTPGGRGITPGELTQAQLGIDLSRGFRALKVWMALLVHGVDTYAAMVEQNVAQANYLAELVEADERLELLAPVALNVVCFRYRGAVEDVERLNAINKEVLLRLQESGVAAPSGTVLHGRFAIRAAITNHRTRRGDLEVLVRAVGSAGDALAVETVRSIG